MEKVVPVILLSGFLGSGKTTLLTRLLEYYKQKDQRPAVIMNELGDVNLDGVLVQEDVPMSEMLSGCICCTISGDLGLVLKELVEENQPDVIIIESTGVAHPMEVFDAVTEASLILKIELTSIVTVVDAQTLMDQSRKGKGKTFRLMQDQIRCASILILNKIDLVTKLEERTIECMVSEWNRYASIYNTVNCEFGMSIFNQNDELKDSLKHNHEHLNQYDHDENHDHEHHHDHEYNDGEHHDHGHHHHSHDHVMVYTHYLNKPIERMQFEQMMYNLPDEIYRGKGILRFTDTPGQFMYQYAFKALSMFRIDPQGKVPDVAVFIGENMRKQELETNIKKL